MSSAVATPCNDEHQDDGESCDHGESFHQAGPMSSTKKIDALGELLIRLGAPVKLEVKAQPTKVTEPAEKVFVAKTVTPLWIKLEGVKIRLVPWLVPAAFVSRISSSV